ncbi:MAG: hypothetical protein IPK83_16115 [Planctomycetes bacterium]|nr:hypothetical protein [Planctomycetota bacterium]
MSRVAIQRGGRALACIAAAVALIPAMAWADSITPPAAINLSVDPNRAASTGAGAGDTSVAFGNMFVSDTANPGPGNYTPGAGNFITVAAAPGYEIDPAAAMISSAAFGFEGNAAGVATAPTVLGDGTLQWELTSGGTAGSDVILLTGIAVRNRHIGRGVARRT